MSQPSENSSSWSSQTTSRALFDEALRQYCDQEDRKGDACSRLPKEVVENLVNRLDIAPDAEILVLYNFEVVHYLIKECKVDPSQITLYTQSRLKAELAEACGVNVRVGEHPLDL